MSDESQIDREARFDRIEDALFDHLRRPIATSIVVMTMVIIHLGLGWIMMSEGDFEWYTLLISQRDLDLLSQAGAMIQDLVNDGQVYRVISCIFLHGDGLHLFLNAIALFALGRLCEAVYGSNRFVLLLLISGMCGATVSWLGGHASSVGASGGIFGLMGACVVFGWKYRQQLPPPISTFFTTRLLPWVGLNLIIGIVVPFIDNLAHCGGLLAGALVALVFGNNVIPDAQSTPLWRRLTPWLSAVLLTLAVIGVATT